MKAILDIIHIWFREFTEAFKDKGILTFILFVPLVYPLLYSYVYTNEVVRNVPVVIVDESNSSLSRELIRKMDAAPDIEIVSRCSNMSDAREFIKKQEAYGIVRIPSDFTRELSSTRQAPLGVYCDMSSMLYYKAVLLAVTNVSLGANKEIKAFHYIPGTTDRQDEIIKMPIDYDYVPLYNPQSGFAAFLIPPVLMLIIQQALLLGIGMSTGNARERNNGRVIPDSPLYRNPVEIVAGKSIPYFLLYILLAVYMFTFVNHLFTLPRLGEYRTFIAFAVPFILACIFLATVFSFFIYRREDCILLFVFLSVPMLFLSGLSWPSASMPEFWKYFSYLFPSTFGMNGYVRITAMGASIHDIKPDYMALWIQTGVYFLLACLLYRREITGRCATQGCRKKGCPPTENFVKDGMRYHLNNDFHDLRDFITRIPEHDYETEHVFCNNRNIVEKVEINGKHYVVKKYKRPTRINCFIYTFFRKSKAHRAYLYAFVLDSEGIDTPRPVAYIESRRFRLFHTGWFIAEYKDCPSLRTVLDSPAYRDRKETILKEFVLFTYSLHKKGIRHKDYNPGNILVRFSEFSEKPEFTLIDINQMNIGRKPGVRKSITAFMQNHLRLKEEIMPMVCYYSRLRKMPFGLCRFACYRYYILRGIRRVLKKPIKTVALALNQ